MPIREKSFRIGCGRYVQEPGLLKDCGAEIRRLGQAPLIVGGHTALRVAGGKIEKSVAQKCEHYEIVEHRGTCNRERAEQLADLAKEKGYDIIVGVGGGVMMDFAKLIAHLADLPIINIPTSSATCAAYTPLSVCYTPEGHTVGTTHFEREVNAVLVDSEIMAAQPIRLLLAGVFDALAKFIEIRHRFDEQVEEFPIGLDWAYVMARHSYQVLTAKTEQCIADMKRGEVTDTVEQVIFAALAATGVISGIARGSNQCALAHKFYENTRTLFHESALPYLHGEIVGVGLLLQNYFNGEEENNTSLLGLMEQYEMPSGVADVGVTVDAATKAEYFERLTNCSSIDENNEDELRRLQAALDYLWARG